MNLKEYLFLQRIRGSDIAKGVELPPPLVSQIVNGVIICPKKHQEKLAKFLKVSVQEIQTNNISQKRRGT